jgi:hypothetical protein
MSVLDSLIQSLMSPMVLAFALGVLATLLRSDLKFPEEIYAAMTIYLLFAIGLKGGAKLTGVSVSDLWKPALAGLSLSLAIPVWTFFILQRIGKLDTINAAAIAAHYGSVSAVTFGEAQAFLGLQNLASEPFMPALLAIMEVPAIIVALLLARKSVLQGGAGPRQENRWGKVLHELLTSKGILLLVGGLIIGVLGGKKGFDQLAPVIDVPFRGVLTFFLLEVGLVTGRRLADLGKAGPFLLGFAVILPLLHGILGAGLGHMVGLSVGGSTLLATLAASASYIAAPAAVRIALPQASPALYLTSSLAVTFPFNVVLGIPIYFSVARAFASGAIG